MSRPVVAYVDLAALRHNARRVRELAPGCRIYGAIKANGYGHGAHTVARALIDGVDGFAVIEVEVAVAIRATVLPDRSWCLRGFTRLKI